MDDLSWQYDAGARDSRRKASACMLLVFTTLFSISLSLKVGATPVLLALVAFGTAHWLLLRHFAAKQRGAQAEARRTGALGWPALIPAGYVADAHVPGNGTRLRPDVQIRGRFMIERDRYRWVPAVNSVKSFGCGEIQWGNDWRLSHTRVFGTGHQSHVRLSRGDEHVDLWLWWTADLPPSA